jgi:hypothetical protein
MFTTTKRKAPLISPARGNILSPHTPTTGFSTPKNINFLGTPISTLKYYFSFFIF